MIPPVPTGAAPDQSPSRCNRTRTRDIVALTSGPPSRPCECSTYGPALEAALIGSRIDPIFPALSARRKAPQIRGGAP
jgi:hypothetical protein